MITHIFDGANKKQLIRLCFVACSELALTSFSPLDLEFTTGFTTPTQTHPLPALKDAWLENMTFTLIPSPT